MGPVLVSVATAEGRRGTLGGGLRGYSGARSYGESGHHSYQPAPPEYTWTARPGFG
jgi:hypothetical protein